MRLLEEESFTRKRNLQENDKHLYCSLGSSSSSLALLKKKKKIRKFFSNFEFGLWSP